jgi:hypothetical protein
MHADPQVRREYLRAYAQSEKGRAARDRAHARYVEKRRAAKLARIDAKPLAQAIAHWRH